MNKNCVFHFLLFVVSVSTETQESNLIVLDSNTKEENPPFLIRHTDEPLELICKLKNFTEENVSLSWELPPTVVNGTFKLIGDDDSYNETSIIMRHDEIAENGSIKISINSLQESHRGVYKCVWTNGGSTVHQAVTIVVKPKKVTCGKKFECGGNHTHCIPIFYKCDGVVDCKETKSDESPDLCGLNPCHDRVMCRNGRCIPKEWCKVCDPLKSNCTNRYRHECCPPLDPFPKGHPPFREGSYSGFNDFPDSANMQHQYDINFIQTTIYTIIGCALVFMIIVTILVIAICRVHMKRSHPSHLLNNRRVFSSTAYHRAFTQEIGVYDVDIAMNRDGPGLLVTYNINNGVQIVGSPVEPPPYSEVASAPPREGPPPPYALAPPGEGDVGSGVRSVQCETSPCPPGWSLRRPSALSPHHRVSSEPSLPNLNRL